MLLPVSLLCVSLFVSHIKQPKVSYLLGDTKPRALGPDPGSLAPKCDYVFSHVTSFISYILLIWMPFILALSSILSFCSDLSSVPEWVDGVTYDFPVLLTEGTICT